MNSVILIGNLTRDPELRYSTGASQNAFCRFTVAVNDRSRNSQTGEWEDRPSFLPVVVFGRQAENCDRYLKKGSKVAVSGRLQTGSYVNRDGNKVYTTDVVANNVEFLSPKGEGGSGYGGYGQGQQSFDQGQPFGQNQAPAGGFSQDEPFRESSQQDPAQGMPDGFQALQDDDIPF